MPAPTSTADCQVVVVTGAGGHEVGAGIAAALAERGHALVLNDVDEQGLAAAAERLPGAVTVPGDLGRPDVADRLVHAAVEAFGRVDALVNNAGVGLARDAHLADEPDVERLLATNLRAPWLTARAFARARIAAGGGGVVVNVSSVHAQRTRPGYALYAATKGAIESLTRGLAVELGPHGIRCNAVAPGAVLDPAHAERYWPDDPDPRSRIDHVVHHQQAIPRPVLPIDVGHVVALLLTPEAWAVTGQTITVDAGLTTLLFDHPAPAPPPQTPR